MEWSQIAALHQNLRVGGPVPRRELGQKHIEPFGAGIRPVVLLQPRRQSSRAPVGVELGHKAALLGRWRHDGRWRE